MKKRRIFVWIAVAAILSTASVTWLVAEASPTWSISANIAESCNCNPACPCIFGSPSTNTHCEGSRLVEIEKAQHDGVSLDGIPVVIAFRMGEYVEYYVGDQATDEQFEAVTKLMDAVFAPMADWGVLSTEKVPVSIERTNTRVKYSTPKTAVDIEVMKGANDRPVRVHDLPAAFLADYTQYVAKENSHRDAKHDFEYSGTNGFTSRLETEG